MITILLLALSAPVPFPRADDGVIREGYYEISVNGGPWTFLTLDGKDGDLSGGGAWHLWTGGWSGGKLTKTGHWLAVSRDRMEWDTDHAWGRERFRFAVSWGRVSKEWLFTETHNHASRDVWRLRRYKGPK